MKNLREKFGKFAVSKEEMAKVKGGDTIHCYGRSGEGIIAFLDDDAAEGYNTNSESEMESAVGSCTNDTRCIGCW